MQPEPEFASMGPVEYRVLGPLAAISEGRADWEVAVNAWCWWSFSAMRTK